MIEGKNIPNKRVKKWSIPFVFIVFISGILGHSFGQGHIGGKMIEEKKYSEKECHKKFAVDLNNLVWSLLERDNRIKKDDEMMVHAAHASCFHWSKVGTEVNLQRGEWLISHVYAVLNRPASALHYAKRCMDITDENKFGDWTEPLAGDRELSYIVM